MTILVFYLTNEQLIATAIKGGSIVERQVFAVADIESGALGAFLGVHRNLPTHVVTDLVEEDFRLDTAPHLRGGDRDALLSRKLAQIYRASNYRHAIVQGREETGRRDDRVFYHAVTNGEMLRPLLGMLAEFRVPLEGVYSSAVLSGRLLQALDLVFPHTLLVTIVPAFGLRQTYFQGRHVKFSRLTHVADDGGRTGAQQIAAETSRTWQYLDSLRYFGDDDSLEVCMLVHERDRAALQNAIANYPLLRFRFLDIGEVAAKLGMPPPPSSHADGVLSVLYAKGGLENHFADKTQLRFAVYRRWRIGIFVATGLVLAAAVAFSGFNLYQASRVSSANEQRSAMTRRVQTEYQDVLQSIKQQRTGTDTVRDTAVFFNAQIRPYPASPGDLMREIAEATAAFPNIRLLQLAWSAGNQAVSPPLQLSTLQTALPLTSDTTSTGATKGGPAGAQRTVSTATIENDPPLAGNKLRIALIEALIVSFDGDYRRMIGQIEDYRAALAALPGCQAEVVTMPVEFDTRVNLKVGLPMDSGTAVTPRFVIKLVKTVQGT